MWVVSGLALDLYIVLFFKLNLVCWCSGEPGNEVLTVRFAILLNLVLWNDFWWRGDVTSLIFYLKNIITQFTSFNSLHHSKGVLVLDTLVRVPVSVVLPDAGVRDPELGDSIFVSDHFVDASATIAEHWLIQVIVVALVAILHPVDRIFIVSDILINQKLVSGRPVLFDREVGRLTDLKRDVVGLSQAMLRLESSSSGGLNHTREFFH